MESKKFEVLGVILDIYEYCPEILGSSPRTPATKHTCWIPRVQICRIYSVLLGKVLGRHAGGYSGDSENRVRKQPARREGSRLDVRALK